VGLFFLVVCLLTLAGVWLFFYLDRAHFHEGLDLDRQTPPSHPSEQFYMLSAVLAAGAGLLTAAVLALAPVLSLALHQSYDGLLQLTTTPLPSEDAEQKRPQFAASCADVLRKHEAVYRLLNPLYYGTWGVSCLFLIALSARLVAWPWVGRQEFRSSMAFFAISLVISAVFALVSLAFFLYIRPGLTKLEFYVKYLDMLTPEQPKSAPESPIKRLARPATVVLALLTAAVLLVAVVYRPDSGLPRLRVAINSNAVATAPFFVANDSDVRAIANSLPLDEVPFAAGRLALDGLLGGQADLATAAETPVLQASVGRPDLRIILELTRSDLRIVARRSAAIRSLADLAGKRVAALEGSSSQYFLEAVLAGQGFPAGRVTPVNLQPADMVSALRNKSIDALSIWEPHAQRAIDFLAEDAIDFDAHDLYVERFLLVTTEEVLADPRKREAVAALVADLLGAAEKIRNDKDLATAIVGKRLTLSTDDVARVWNRFEFPMTLDPGGLVPALAAVEVWASEKQGRQARDAVALRRLLDAGPYEQARGGRGAPGTQR
jgi:NitT/TauT family transport system substrate-binding protein